MNERSESESENAEEGIAQASLDRELQLRKATHEERTKAARREERRAMNEALIRVCSQGKKASPFLVWRTREKVMEATNMCESEHQKFQKKYNEALETRKEKKNPKSKKKRKENSKKKPLVTHSLHPYEYFCHLLISSSTLSDTPSLKPPLEYVAHLFQKKKERLAFIPNSTEKK